MTLPNKLAQKISKELNYNEEKSAVISYGIFACIHVLASLTLVALFGVLLGIVVQALIVSFASSILRQYSGGVHATRPSTCLTIGTIITILITLIAHYFTKLIPVELLVCINGIIMGTSYYLIIRYAPVDSPSKPIKTQSKRKKMKKLSLIVLSVYVICISVFVILYFNKGSILNIEYSMSICMATGWQAFTLTVKGHRFINKIDSILINVFFKKGAIS